MLSALKSRLLNIPLARAAWGAYRSAQFHREYRVRREAYARQARERKLVYSEQSTHAAVRERLKRRGYSPTPRSNGEVHTFAFVPRISWHAVLYNDLAELGPVSEYDYAKDGFDWDEFAACRPASVRRRREMNARVIPALREAHRRRPVDWIYFYASGLEFSPELIRTIEGEFGIPTVSMCLDDKNAWCGPVIDASRAGQIDIAPVFDLAWTSARVACEWYLCEGGRPLYLPEGFDASVYRPDSAPPEFDVTFVGAAYGFRPAVARFLHKHKILLKTFGQGWDGGRVAREQIVRIFNRSRINLGLGGIGYSEELTNVKGRDFDIPGTGGGMYLTTFNSDLAQHFEIGREIVCYRNRDELLELIRYYLAHEGEAREIARRGRMRCLKEHRWLHRFEHVCRVLGVME